METKFINTKSNITNEPHISTLSLVDKVNLYYHGKILYLLIIIINLRYVPLHGMMNLIYLMGYIL